MKTRKFSITVSAQDLRVEGVIAASEAEKKLRHFLYDMGFDGTSIIIDELDEKTNYKTRKH